MAIGSFTCFAIAAPGLEPVVARELEALGEQPRIEDGGVTWTGDARSLMRANLWLRTASRVLVRIAEFEATAFHQLERHAKHIEWSRFIPAGRDADFRVTARKSRLYHSDAIAQRLQAALGTRPSALGARPSESRAPRAESHDSQLFVVRVVRDRFTVSVDTSGELLHVRGYRQAVGKAPLRETLAAALLLAADWDGTTPVVDPFCGSGTVPIEAALIARRIAPGARRTFAFMQWPDFDAKAWGALLDTALTGALAGSPVPIVGSDRDAGAVESALSNAARAGVSSDVALSVRAVSAMEAPDGVGLVATNPPYGKRVGEARSLRNLYAQFGKVLRQRCAGWRIAFYSPGSELARQLEIHLEEAFRTSNGGIRVAALRGQIAVATDSIRGQGHRSPSGGTSAT